MIPGLETPGVARLERLLHRTIQVGSVSDVDLGRARVRVAYDRDENGRPVRTGWLRWNAGRAGATRDWNPPSIGEQVLLLAPGGDLAAAVVVGAFFQDAHPPPAGDAEKHLVAYPDGAEIDYDAASHHLRVELPAGATVALSAPGGVSVNGELTVKGDVDVSGSIEGRSVADAQGDLGEIRSVYNRHVHTTPPAGLPPGSPVEKMA